MVRGEKKNGEGRDQETIYKLVNLLWKGLMVNFLRRCNFSIMKRFMVELLKMQFFIKWSYKIQFFKN